MVNDMNYAQLSQLNRAQLIEAQEAAILTQDTDTLRRIADLLVNFERLQTPAQNDSAQGLTWLNAEVEDIDDAPDMNGDFDWYTRWAE